MTRLRDSWAFLLVLGLLLGIATACPRQKPWDHRPMQYERSNNAIPVRTTAPVYVGSPSGDCSAVVKRIAQEALKEAASHTVMCHYRSYSHTGWRMSQAVVRWSTLRSSGAT